MDGGGGFDETASKREISAGKGNEAYVITWPSRWPNAAAQEGPACCPARSAPTATASAFAVCRLQFHHRAGASRHPLATGDGTMDNGADERRLVALENNNNNNNIHSATDGPALPCGCGGRDVLLLWAGVFCEQEQE